MYLIQIKKLHSIDAIGGEVHAVPDNMFNFKNDKYKDMEFLLKTCPEYNETAKFRNV